MLVKRDTIKSLVVSRDEALENYKKMTEYAAKCQQAHACVHNYGIANINFSSERRHSSHNYSDADSKQFDKYYWYKLLLIFNIERFMLCTEYSDIKSKIYDEHDFLPFTEENIQAFLDGCSQWILDGVHSMLKRVYKELLDGHYYVGKERKKRNLNGVAKSFILHTGDYGRIIFYRPEPTITDDFEKLCYLIDNKELPKIGIIQQVKDNNKEYHKYEAENDYFRLRVCKNGNSHFSFKNGFEQKINLLYADRSKIGSSSKIKIVD